MDVKEWKIEFKLVYEEIPDEKIVLIFGNWQYRLISNFLVIEPKVTFNGQVFIPAEEWKRIFNYCFQHGVELLGWMNRLDSKVPSINFAKYISSPGAVILTIDRNNHYHVEELKWETNNAKIHTGVNPKIQVPDIEGSKNWMNYRLLLVIACCLSIIFTFLYPVMRKIEQPDISVPISQSTEPSSISQVNQQAEISVAQKNNDEQETQFIFYTVQNGDSLWEISKKHYGTGLDFVQIIKDNEIINPALIKVGTVLKIRKK